MLNIDNKMIVSLGGIVVLMPAKPVLILASIGAVTVLSAGYYLIKNSSND